MAEISNNFEAFWKIYPKKAEKIYALQCFNKALKFATAEEIIAGATRYAHDCLSTARPREYIKNPSTWLNKGCWDDEYTVPEPEVVSPEESRRKARLKGFYERGLWNEEWGPRPPENSDERKVIKFQA